MTTILVVEDEAIVAEDIKNTLQNAGYTVPATASSGEDTLKRVKEFNPDIVLMDIPVVYLTAFSDEKTIERAKITEPFGYLVKPEKIIGSQSYKSGWLIPRIINKNFDGMICTIESIPRYSIMDETRA